MRDVTSPVRPSFFVLYVGRSFPPWLYMIPLHFSHGRSNWCSPSSLQHHISELSTHFRYLSALSNLQHRTKLCSKCSNVTSFFLKFLSPICWWKKPSSCRKLLCLGNPGFNFTCTSCIICYHATQIVEAFHIFRLLLLCHNLHCGWML